MFGCHVLWERERIPKLELRGGSRRWRYSLLQRRSRWRTFDHRMSRMGAMRLNFSCAVVGLPCLQTVCYRIEGKLAWSLSWGQKPKDRQTRVARKVGKISQWREKWSDDNVEVGPLKRLHVCHEDTSCSEKHLFLFLLKNSVELRKVTSDNSIEFYRTSCFDVDSYIKDLDVVEPLA